MELILKSNDQQSMAEIIALAIKLNMNVEINNKDIERSKKADLKDRIMNFKAISPSSFADAEAWQRQQREDRNLL